MFGQCLTARGGREQIAVRVSDTCLSTLSQPRSQPVLAREWRNNALSHCACQVNTSKTPCMAMYERARKREVCFWCGFNVKTEWFPRQQNWTRTCECAVTPPPTFVNLLTIGSLVTHQILAKLANRILTYGDGGGCTCARAEIPHPTHDLWKAST